MAAPKPKPPLRLAVIDLTVPTSVPWLGPAIAEAVSVKLAGVKAVTLIERERIEEAMAAAKGSEVTPKLLGVDAILTGSVQMVGAFGPEAKLRISAKVIGTESAKLKGESAFVLDGTVGELFALESTLAGRFCAVLGREATALQLDYREEQNLKAKQLFAEGIALLRQGEYRKATQSFRAAQEANEGSFYARAHSYEGQARERLAVAQKDDAAAKAIRDETVTQFRKDAAEAAPAFYDLARAYQADGNYEEAIQAYDQFGRWYDRSARPFAFSVISDSTPVVTEEGPGVYAHGKRWYDQNYYQMSKLRARTRSYVLDRGELIQLNDRGELLCHRLSNGEERWRVPLTRGKVYSRRCLSLIVRESSVFYVSEMGAGRIDRSSGKHILFPVDVHALAESSKGRSFALNLRLCFLPTQDRLVIFAAQHLFCLEASTGRVLAQNASLHPGLVRPIQFGDRLYCGEGTVLYEINATTGEKRQIQAFQALSVGGIWRGRDHLLIRLTPNAAKAAGDRFLKYYPKSQKRETATSLFFSTFYDRVPDAVEKLSIPVTDRRSGEYRLIPAAWLLPLTQVPKMDRAHGLYIPTQALPWVELNGQSIWLWKGGEVSRYRLADRMLLWRSRFPGSESAVAADGKRMAIQTVNAVKVYRARNTGAERLSVQALVGKADALRSLGRYAQALEVLHRAAKNDYSSASVRLSAARAHRALGNRNDAIFEYGAVLTHGGGHRDEGGREAFAYLADHMGLVAWGVEEQPLWRKACNAGAVEIASGYVLGVRLGRLYPRPGLDPNYRLPTPIGASQIKEIEQDPDPGSEILLMGPDGAVMKRITLHGNDNRFYRCSAPHPDWLHLGDIVVLGLKGRRLAAYDLRTGKELWQRVCPDRIQVGGAGSTLILATCDYNASGRQWVWRLDPRTGEEVWKASFHHTVGPGLVAGSRFTNVWRDQPFVPHPFQALIHVAGGEVLLTYLDCQRRERWNPQVWPQPRHPLYRLDLASGELRERHIMSLEPSQLLVKRELVGFYPFRWGYSTLPSDYTVLLNGFSPSRNPHLPAYRVRPADFMETHPRQLARFAPLAHLATEWDIEQHAKALNRLLANPAACRDLVATYRNELFSRARGHEAILAQLRHILKRPSPTESELRFAARQIMSLWKGSEPDVHLRPYHDPAPLALENPVAVPLDGVERTGVLGTAGAERRLMVVGPTPAQARLYPTRWSPRLSEWSLDELAYNEFADQVRLFVDGGIAQRYERSRLLHFLTQGIQYHQGAFSVGPVESLPSLSLAFDGDPQTEVLLPARLEQNRCLGIDRGLVEPVNRIRLFPAKGRGADLVGSFLQASQEGEAGGYTNLAVITGAPQEGAWLTLSLRKAANARYFRLLTPVGKPLAVAELEFGYGPQAVDVSSLLPGLRYRVYEGLWGTFVDFTREDVIKEGRVAGFDISVNRRVNNFAIVFDGYLRVPQDGRYEFRLQADALARLLLEDRERVRTADTLQGRAPIRTGSMECRAGWIPLRLEFMEGVAKRMLKLEWRRPGDEWQAIPATALAAEREW
ncbi:MAG: PA14 domain-containing protein [Planctomycetota bacterium]|jgi:tetratricopeptide (TPR) repeat protein